MIQVDDAVPIVVNDHAVVARTGDGAVNPPPSVDFRIVSVVWEVGDLRCSDVSATPNCGSPHLRIVPGKVSGAPHLESSRITAQTIAALHDRLRSVEQLASYYPEMTLTLSVRHLERQLAARVDVPLASQLPGADLGLPRGFHGRCQPHSDLKT